MPGRQPWCRRAPSKVRGRARRAAPRPGDSRPQLRCHERGKGSWTKIVAFCQARRLSSPSSHAAKPCSLSAMARRSGSAIRGSPGSCKRRRPRTRSGPSADARAPVRPHQRTSRRRIHRGRSRRRRRGSPERRLVHSGSLAALRLRSSVGPAAPRRAAVPPLAPSPVLLPRPGTVLGRLS